MKQGPESQRGQRLVVVFLIATVVTLVLIRVPVHFWGYDRLIRMASERPNPDPGLVIVAIDETSRERLGKWPWPWSVHAGLLAKLAAHKPRLVVFDILFSQGGDPAQTAALRREMSKLGNVILGNTLRREAKTRRLIVTNPIKALREAALDVGLMRNPVDEDGKIRRAQLVVPGPKNLLPSLALVTASHSLGARWKLTRDRRCLLSRGEGTAGFGDLPIRLGPDLDIWIDYASFGPKGFDKNTHSYVDVLENEELRKKFKDKIIVVGTTDPILHDRYLTPMVTEVIEAASGPKGADKADSTPLTPGVVIHAHTFQTIVNERFLQEPDAALEIFLLFLVSLLMTAAGCLLPPRKGIPLALLLLVIILGAAWGLYNNGILLDWARLCLAVVATTMLSVGYLYREARARREWVQSIFGHFVPPHLVDRLVENPELLQQEGRLELRTILIADLRGFTPLANRLGPLETVRLLNRHFGEVAEIIFRNDGIIDKFMGDAVMAIFGETGGTDPQRLAVKAACEMQDAVDKINETQPEDRRCKMGIGIATGEVIVGHIGSRQKREYTVIGEAANLAARLEKVSKTLTSPIVADRATRDGAGDGFAWVNAGIHEVRGFADGLELFTVGGGEGEEK